MITHFENDDNAIDQGLVIMWSGLMSDIPDGFALCDGNNGTPDYTDRMIRGAADPTVEPSGTGGSDSITLSNSQMADHTHNGSVGNIGNHRHTLSSEDVFSNSNNISGDAHSKKPNSDPEAYVDPAGSHSHNVGISSTGSGSSIDNQPPYYRVAFLTRL